MCRHPSNLANGDVKSSDLKRLGIISHNGLARAGRIPEGLEMGNWMTFITCTQLEMKLAELVTGFFRR